MPVLYKYKDKPGGYIISPGTGQPCTHQLAPDGPAILQLLGYDHESSVDSKILGQLVRVGLAFIPNSGRWCKTPVPDLEVRIHPGGGSTYFPLTRCDCCFTFFNLLLVTYGAAVQLQGEVVCHDCFNKYGIAADSLHRFYFTNAALSDLLQLLVAVPAGSTNFHRFTHLLIHRRELRFRPVTFLTITSCPLPPSSPRTPCKSPRGSHSNTGPLSRSSADSACRFAPSAT